MDNIYDDKKMIRDVATAIGYEIRPKLNAFLRNDPEMLERGVSIISKNTMLPNEVRRVEGRRRGPHGVCHAPQRLEPSNASPLRQFHWVVQTKRAKGRLLVGNADKERPGRAVFPLVSLGRSIAAAGNGRRSGGGASPEQFALTIPLLTIRPREAQGGA